MMVAAKNSPFSSYKKPLLCSLGLWHRDTGDYVGTVRALLEAGAILPPHAAELEPSDAVLEVLP